VRKGEVKGKPRAPSRQECEGNRKTFSVKKPVSSRESEGEGKALSGVGGGSRRCKKADPRQDFRPGNRDGGTQKDESQGKIRRYALNQNGVAKRRTGGRKGGKRGEEWELQSYRARGKKRRKKRKCGCTLAEL